MPCQRWMVAMLRQLGLDKNIANENVPGVAKEGQRIVAQRKWRERDARPEMHPNRFSDYDGNAEMIHISGGMTVTAREMMWELLTVTGKGR